MPNNTELAFLRAQIQQVEGKLGELTSKASQIPSMQEAHTFNAQQKSELNTLQIQIATHAQYLATLQLQYAPLEQQLAQLQISNSTLQAKEDRLQPTVQEHQSKVNVLQSIQTKMVNIFNTYIESNGVKLDSAMIYTDITPPEYLVHTSAFTDAIMKNHIEAFNLALSKISSDDINYRDSKGKTLLMYSAGNAFLHGVEKLLQHGAKAQMYDKEGYNALYYTANMPHIVCFKLIADQTVNLNAQYLSASSNTAAHILIANTRKVLFSNEFEPNQYASLNDMTVNGTLSIYGGFQAFNVNTNCTVSGIGGPRPEDDYTTGEDKILHILNLMGDDIPKVLNIQNEEGRTPFALACANQLKYLANQLYDKYSPIINDIRDVKGISYFILGAHLRDTTLLQKFIDKNFYDINNQDNEGLSALHWMAHPNYKWNDIAIWLVNHGSNIDLQTNTGDTALSLAAQSNNVELVNYLLTHEARHNIPTKQGVYPWHMAAYCGSLEALKALQSQIPDIDWLTEGEKVSALWYAARQGNVPVVEWLISQGANLNIKHPSNGWTPLFAACYNKKLDVAKLLVSSDKFQTDSLDGVQYNSMHWLVFAGDHGEVMNILHAKNPNLINQRNIYNATPLNWNILQRHSIEGMKALISYGSDINATFVQTVNIQGTNNFVQLAKLVNGTEYLLEYIPFTIACALNEVEKAKYIMKLPNFKGEEYVDPQKFTILHWALEMKDTKMIHDLCTKHPTLVDKADMYNKTPLAWVVESLVKATDVPKQTLFKHFISELLAHGAQVSDMVRACAGDKSNLLEAAITEASNDHTALEKQYIVMGEALELALL